MSATTEVAAIDLLSRFSDAWLAGDIDTLMDCVTDDCLYSASVGPEPGRTYQGRDEVRRGFLAMLAQEQGHIHDGGPARVLGDVAVAEWAVQEHTPDGHLRVVRGCDIFELAGGKIRRKDAFRKVSTPPPDAPDPAGTGGHGRADR